MSTSAQIAANRTNSQLSTGPKTEAGKAAAARNNIRHGLASASAFQVLPTESQFEFDELLAAFRGEHQPATPTEAALVALCLRYQSTHERGFHKCLNALLKLRAEKRKAEIGFESQKHKNEEQARKQEKHAMAKERHKWDLLLTEAKIDHQQIAVAHTKNL
jgi:hypothetical protein